MRIPIPPLTSEELKSPGAFSLKINPLGHLEESSLVLDYILCLTPFIRRNVFRLWTFKMPKGVIGLIIRSRKSI